MCAWYTLNDMLVVRRVAITPHLQRVPVSLGYPTCLQRTMATSSQHRHQHHKERATIQQVNQTNNELSMSMLLFVVVVLTLTL